jgi:thioredoxin-dependent peroxiredoxin
MKGPSMLETGSPAPDFTLPDASGNTISLSSLRGKKVVLYFYPKDMTPSCTQESYDFRDRHAALQAAGAVVVGVSPDSPKSHTRFAAKYALPFTLLADEDSAVARAYGVGLEREVDVRAHVHGDRADDFPYRREWEHRPHLAQGQGEWTRG